MDKAGVISILEEIAVLLELQGENPFKVRAYQNAARALEAESASLSELVASGRLGTLKGIGPELLKKITALAETGALPFYETLKASVPAGLLDLLRVPGLGPKRARLLYDQLGITSLGELEYACNENRLAALKGFGTRTQANILQGLAFLRQSAGQFLFAVVRPQAEEIAEFMRRAPGVEQCDLAGSLRRCKEIIRDADVLVAARDSGPVMAHFVRFPAIDRVLAAGETKSSVLIKSGLQVDLRVVSPEQYPFALHYFTGSKEHNTAVRGRAKDRGLKLNEYGLWRGETLVPCRSEAELFAALGLAYIEPELRENTGEIEAAATGTLPRLVEQRDLRGLLHVHSAYSDGRNSIAELRQACTDLGYSYLLICDHSKSAAYAGGLSEERVAAQHEEIDALNREGTGARVLKGIEVDILADGQVDYDDEVLSRFDLVIASVHSGFRSDEAAMTARVCRALENPRVHILGHPTGRLLLTREGYPLDIEQVLRTASEHGKAIELNAHPQRLDLDWRYCKRARELGVQISINPDAHNLAGLLDMQYGVAAARRGWLEASDVLNSRSKEDLLAWAAAGGSR